jgi:hypothetical protein
MNKENRDGKIVSKKRTSHTPATKPRNLLQGSVLPPILFNLYMSDLTNFSLNLLQYANEMAQTHRARKFEKCFYVQIHQKLKFVCFT